MRADMESSLYVLVDEGALRVASSCLGSEVVKLRMHMSLFVRLYV